MKTIITLILSIALCGSIAAQSEFYHFKFAEKSKQKINGVLTQTISIDKVVGDTIFAYANSSELEKFKALGYSYQIIPRAIPTKALTMATTVEQMASWDRYPTYEVYRALLKKFEADYPTLCKLDTIGSSINGRKLYVVKISGNVTSDEAEPEVFYTSTMHGDETTGYILMLRLINHLLTEYGTNQRITDMVNNMAIFINPNSNPDGTYKSGNSTVSGAIRYNANYVDLNRNFPDPRRGDHPDGNSWQPENVAMMSYAASRRFVLSANFHGGIELANYPWDTWTSISKTHADNNWYINVSRQYATLAQTNSPSGYFTGENNGITNGGDWYVVAGGRQDYMNWWHHCREVTFEISDTKLLPTEQLPALWNYNRDALLTYLECALLGFNGTIKNSNGEPIRAKVFIENHDRDSSHVYSNAQHGTFYRPIEPGTWRVTFTAPGYSPQTHTVVVDSWTSSTQVNLNVVMYPTGVTTNSMPNINLWPNPFTNKVYINIPNQLTNVRVSIYSLSGQLIKAIQGNGSGTIVWDGKTDNGQTATPGVYIVKATTNGSSATAKVIFSPQ